MDDARSGSAPTFVLAALLACTLPSAFIAATSPKMEHSWKAHGATTNDELIDQLKAYQIINTPRVEAAMRAVDRKQYSAKDAGLLAYKDSPHSIGHGATISAPHMHAYCLEQLSDLLKPGARVLDVGSGSGYLTACFGEMVKPGGRVLGIDIIPELVTFSISNMKRGNPDLLESGIVSLIRADGWQELKGMEFDVIHVGAAAATVPSALVSMLRKGGGKMIIPVGTHTQSLMLVTRHEDGTATQENLMGVVYVPLVNTGKPNIVAPGQAPTAGSVGSGAPAKKDL